MRLQHHLFHWLLTFMLSFSLGASTTLAAVEMNLKELPANSWSVHSVSTEAEDSPAGLAIDYRTNTYWVSAPAEFYGQVQALDLDLGVAQEVSGVRYIPQINDDKAENIAYSYQVFVSNNPEDWGNAVAAGLFNYDQAQPVQLIKFPEITGQFVRLELTSEQDSGQVGIAELGLLTPADGIYIGQVLKNGSFENYSGDFVRVWGNRQLSDWVSLDTTDFGTGAEIGFIDVQAIPLLDQSEVWRWKGRKATHSRHKLELDAGNRVDAIGQEFQTVANQNYVLSFDAYARKRHSSDIEVWIDGQHIETLTPLGYWQRFKFHFTGNGSTQNLMLREVPNQNNRYGAIIDNVSVIGQIDANTVPGPGINLGKFSITHQPLAIPFQHAFRQPVVIAGTPSNNEQEPGVVRLNGLTANGVYARFQEWDYLDGVHAAEEMGLIVVEAGRYVMTNGIELEAGYFDLDRANKRSDSGARKFIDFTRSFPGKPALFLTLQTENDPAPVAIRAKRVKQSGFEAILEEEEASSSEHGLEKVGYLALWVPEGVTELDGTPFQQAQVVVRHKPVEIFGHDLWVEEEQSRDNELGHTKERYDVLSFDQGEFFAQDVSFRGGDTAVPRQAIAVPDVVLDGLSASEIGQHSVTLNWNPASGDDADQVAVYQILRNGQATAQSATTSSLISGLTPETEYSFSVDAVDSNGKVLASTHLLQVTTEAVPLPPLAPSNLVASDITWSSAHLHWQAPGSGPQPVNYNVYRNNQVIATVSANSFTDSGLTPETQYNYLVTSVTEELESVNGASIGVTTVTEPDVEPPPTPAWLRADTVTGSSVQLNWDLVEDNRAMGGYKLFRDGVEIADTATTSYTDSDVRQASSYSYSVQAYDLANNYSAQSQAISVTVPDVTAPATPEDLNVTETSNKFSLTWSSSSDNVGVIGYRIYRDGSLILTTTELGFVDSSVVIGVNYSYQISAIDAAGNESTRSEPATIVIEAPAVTGQALAETCSGCHGSDGISVGPATPTLAGMRADYFEHVMSAFQSGERHSNIMGRVAKAYSNTEIELMAQHYAALPFSPAQQTVNLSLVAQGHDLHNTHCASCHGSDGTEMENGILAGQWKDYLLYTLDDFGNQRSTDVPAAMVNLLQGFDQQQRLALAEYYASFGSDTVPPPAPTDLAVAAKTETSISLTWMEVEDNWQISHYQLYRGDTAIGTTEFSVFTDTGLIPGDIYNYQVVAIDHVGNRSAKSSAIAARTLGEPTGVDPGVQRGEQLWQAKGCGNCHGAPVQFVEHIEQKYSGAKSFSNALMEAIATNKGGMGIFAELSGQNVVDLSAFIAYEKAQQEAIPAKNLDGVLLLSNQQTLRKASILLAGRLPTTAEQEQAATEEGLAQALRNLMQGERFTQFIVDTSLRSFLTRGVGLDQNALLADFPNLETLRDTDRPSFTRAMNAMRDEAVQLARHIVEHDRPWSEIITADYTLVNSYSAQGYGDLQWLDEPAEADDFAPARIQSTSARTDELASKPYPHAGVLSTPAWLSRFPTTDSNRNRHRAKMVYRQFLGFDIESLGQRPLDDSQNGNYLVPTMENPACLLCHTNMEPVASAFQNWGTRNQYWQNGEESLSSDYKGRNYYLDHQDQPWHRDGDKWYRDMFAAGFEGKSMPGEYFGFNLPNPASELIARDNWVVLEETPNQYSRPLALAFDGDDQTIYHSQYRPADYPMPHVFSVDMGEMVETNGLRYLPRQSGTNWHIQDYQIELSNDGVAWRVVNSGRLSESRAAKDLTFSLQPARYFRLTIFSQTRNTETRNLTTIAELYALKPKDLTTIPFATNSNGSSDSLQWLAQEVANDPRFAKAAVRFWYTGLFGIKPLDAPVNSAAPGYTEQLAAFQTQENQFDQIAQAFVDQGLKVKDLLVALATSDLFRANASNGALNSEQQQALSQVATGRLLGPAELDAKTQATVGVELFRGAYTSSGILYGGFDGGRVLTEGTSDITPMLLSTAESRVHTALCNQGLIGKEFRKTAEERLLFPYVSDSDQPVAFELPTLPPRSVYQPIERLVWENIGGTQVYKLEAVANYPSAPDQVEYLASFDSANDRNGDRYGVRLRAYVVAPMNGEYTFWVSGDDNVSLRLSSDKDPANLVEIASVPGWTYPRVWDKYPQQQSAAVTLKAGQSYLIEVVHKESYGRDHASVSWAGPGLDGQTILSAAHLAATPSELNGDVMIEAIKRNIRHLHQHLLGEELALDDPEIERTYALFKEVFENSEPETSELNIRCEQTNGSSAIRRAWSAVVAYLMADFRYLNH